MPVSAIKLELGDSRSQGMSVKSMSMSTSKEGKNSNSLSFNGNGIRRERMLRIQGEYPQNKDLAEMEKLIEMENRYTRKIIDQLQALSEETNMPITQENGQRCFGPPRDWNGPQPPKGCEVFVGKLPRDVFEPHLVPLFSKIGQIYEMRIMMDFSGTNRGYCFVQYGRVGDAHAAVRHLNEYEILPGRNIGVMKSVDNCRLFIGGIPKNKTEQEVFEEVSRFTEGVRKAIVIPSLQDRAPNQGFAFIEYNCHKTAAMARRMLIPGNITLWGHDIAVDWAEPELENQIQNLYVRDIDVNTSEKTLIDIFNNASDDGVARVKKIADYAFISFKSHEQADAAKLALDRTDVAGSQIKVYWGKPQEDKYINCFRNGSEASSMATLTPMSQHSHVGRSSSDVRRTKPEANSNPECGSASEYRPLASAVRHSHQPFFKGGCYRNNNGLRPVCMTMTAAPLLLGRSNIPNSVSSYVHPVNINSISYQGQVGHSHILHPALPQIPLRHGNVNSAFPYSSMVAHHCHHFRS